jgi:hypothetical protein
LSSAQYLVGTPNDVVGSEWKAICYLWSGN